MSPARTPSWEEGREAGLPYRVTGEGQPVLFLHGAGGVRLTAGLDELAQRFRVYLPTLPGYDGTPTMPGVTSMQELAHLVHGFAKTAIGPTYDVIGFSFGGWLASWLAVLHPESVQQLALVAPAGFRPEGQGGLNFPHEELQRRLFAHPERATGDDKPPEMVVRNREMAIYYHGRVDSDAELIDRLGEIQCLTLIVQGTRDGVIPAESGRLLRRRIRSSYLAYLFDAAHMIDSDQPARLAGLLEEFFTRGEAFIINWSDSAA
ncbi:MAG TPA: alpha/beta hydrolase [Chloroflexota bacterium]|nr:alpha/beta hydrolase [Chloroflexota bacterium]